MPFSALPPIANLSSYLVKDYGTLGGGLIFGYFYVWFSYAGILFIAFYISWLWRKLTTTVKQPLLVYGILAFSSIGGWYAYTPVTLFKYCLWGMVYFFVISRVYKALSPRVVLQ